MSKSSEPVKPPWKIDPAINVDRASLDDIRFVFAQAEKRLDDSVKTGELITSRTMTLMTLMAGLLIALSGFFISNWNGWAKLNARVLVSLIGVLYILGTVTYMLKNVLPDEYFVLGSYPRDLITPNFYDPALPADKIAILMYISEIENYDSRIDYNRKKNNTRWNRYRHSLIALWLMPMILGVLYMACYK